MVLVRKCSVLSQTFLMGLSGMAMFGDHCNGVAVKYII